MHAVAHELHAVFPAISVTPDARHASLESMANKTFRKNDLLGIFFRPKFLRLVNGKLVPAHHARRERKINPDTLVRRKSDTALRIAAQPDRLDLHSIFAPRQFVDAIMPFVIRQNKNTNFSFCILRLDKRAFHRRPVRSLYRSGERRSDAGCCEAQRNPCKSQEFCSGPHAASIVVPRICISRIETMIGIMPYKPGKLVRVGFREARKSDMNHQLSSGPRYAVGVGANRHGAQNLPRGHVDEGQLICVRICNVGAASIGRNINTAWRF